MGCDVSLVKLKQTPKNHHLEQKLSDKKTENGSTFKILNSTMHPKKVLKTLKDKDLDSGCLRKKEEERKPNETDDKIMERKKEERCMKRKEREWEEKKQLEREKEEAKLREKEEKRKTEKEKRRQLEKEQRIKLEQMVLKREQEKRENLTKLMIK